MNKLNFCSSIYIFIYKITITITNELQLLIKNTKQYFNLSIYQSLSDIFKLDQFFSDDGKIIIMAGDAPTANFSFVKEKPKTKT